MKKKRIHLILLTLLILTGSRLYSQETALFPDNLKWTGVLMDEYSERFDYYVTRGDTVIDDIRRNKLYYRMDGPDSKEGLCAFFHLEGKKVIARIYRHSFYSCVEDGKEMVLYDFDLSVGDSISSYYCGAYNRAVVQAIDSVYVGDSYKKRYDIRTDTWIEGIGSVQELFAPIAYVPTGGVFRRIACVSLNDEVLYLAPDRDECPEVSDEVFRISLGDDVTLCADNIITGGHPFFLTPTVVIGSGFSKRTYIWGGSIKDQNGRVYPASRYLNDTTSTRPQLVASWGNNQWNQFTVEVRDLASGWISRDSINVRFSQYKETPAVHPPFHIDRGDSVLLDASQEDAGGIRPYISYRWTPVEGLSSPDSSVTWSKPENTIEYFCTVTDSFGCQSLLSGAISRKIEVNTSSISSISKEMQLYQSEKMICFENPGSREVSLSFYDLSGKVIHRGRTYDNFYIPSGSFIPGIYLCKVKYENMERSVKYVVR